jgi:hypothetical protein
MGTFGATVEFRRSAAEPLDIDDPAGLTLATARAALRLRLDEPVMPFAYETLSASRDGWLHGIALCRPAAEAAMAGRAVVTELGPDNDALLPHGHGAVLFDLGLGASQADVLVRPATDNALAALRAHAGKPALTPGRPLPAGIPDRGLDHVVVSRLGRIEIAGAAESPTAAPRVQIVPSLLAMGRPHSQAVPIPDGLVPCLTILPPNPLADGAGRPRPFDGAAHAAFQAWLETWGDAVYCREKARTIAAVRAGTAPADYDPPADLPGQTALRIALRQIASTDGASPLVSAWRETFDLVAQRCSVEDFGH